MLYFSLENERANYDHRIDTQPEVRLRVGAFDVGVLVTPCLRYTEDVDVFTKKKQFVAIVQFGTWTMSQNAL